MTTKSDNTNTLETRVLHYIEPDIYKDVNQLFCCYKVESLKLIGQPLVDTLTKYQYLYDKGKGKPKELTVFRDILKSPTQQCWADFITYFFCNENIQFYLDTLPAKERDLWHAVAKENVITLANANRIYGKKCTTTRRWHRELTDELNLFFQSEYKNYFYDADDEGFYLLFRYQFLYKAMFRLFVKSHKPIEKLPTGLLQFMGEAPFFTDFVAIESLHLGNKLKIGKTKLRSISLQKVLKTTPMAEFFTEKNSPNDECDNLRGLSLAVMYELITETYKKKELECYNPQDWAQTVMNCINENDALFYPLFLSHLTGIRSKFINDSFVEDFCEAAADAFERYDEICNNSNSWVHIDEFLYFLRDKLNRTPRSVYIPMPFDITNYPDTMQSNFMGGYIAFEEVQNHIVDSAIKSLCFILASWGILDIAYSTKSTSYHFSPYDGLEYIRLTPLGRYAFYIDEKYQPSVEIAGANTAIFELDANRLLIKLLNPESPKRLSLDQFAKAVTPTLYRTDTASFIKGCTDKSMLEEKIDHFKRLIQTDLPPIWNEFFETLRQQCQPLEKAGKSYLIRRIDKDNKRLQEIIMTDDRLRECILRAENYLLLIESKRMDEITRILRSYGYIL